MDKDIGHKGSTLDSLTPETTDQAIIRQIELFRKMVADGEKPMFMLAQAEALQFIALAYLRRMLMSRMGDELAAMGLAGPLLDEIRRNTIMTIMEKKYTDRIFDILDASEFKKPT